MHQNQISSSMIRLLALLVLIVPSVQSQDTKQDKVTIAGQIVCSDCWSEADRKTTAYGTPADIECALECAEKGIPSAVAVKEGDNYKLYLIEQAQLKTDRGKWLDQIGGQVEVTGRPYTKKGKQYLSVETVKYLSASPAKQLPSTVGSEAELSLKDLAGIDQRLSSYRGRVVVLNFWATWCIPCRKEMPDLAAIQNEYAAFGVQVVGAAADQIADRAKVIQFIKQAGINFPVWLGATTEDMRRFGVGPGLPATVIIGRDGKIAVVHHKVIQQAQLKKEIDKLLGGDSVAAARETGASKPRLRDVSLVPS